MILAWSILAVWGGGVALAVAFLAVRALVRRRAGREQAAAIARRVRARRHPGLPCDGRPLTPNEERLLAEIAANGTANPRRKP